MSYRIEYCFKVSKRNKTTYFYISIMSLNNYYQKLNVQFLVNCKLITRLSEEFSSSSWKKWPIKSISAIEDAPYWRFFAKSSILSSYVGYSSQTSLRNNKYRPFVYYSCSKNMHVLTAQLNGLYCIRKTQMTTSIIIT